MNEQQDTATALDVRWAHMGPTSQSDQVPDAEQAPHVEPLDAEPLSHVEPLDTEAVPHVEPLDAEPVPHVEPLDARPLRVTGSTGSPGPAPGAGDELNQQITDTLTELIKQAHDLGHGIAADFGLTASDTKALFMLEAPMTMKELGLRFGCDPSFVTSIADALEKRGLARREPSQLDRRSKNLVLTPEGVRVRDQICSELSARAPWCNALDTGERQCLLRLMRKMIRFRGGR